MAITGALVALARPTVARIGGISSPSPLGRAIGGLRRACAGPRAARARRFGGSGRLAAVAYDGPRRMPSAESKRWRRRRRRSWRFATWSSTSAAGLLQGQLSGARPPAARGRTTAPPAGTLFRPIGVAPPIRRFPGPLPLAVHARIVALLGVPKRTRHVHGAVEHDQAAPRRRGGGPSAHSPLSHLAEARAAHALAEGRRTSTSRPPGAYPARRRRCNTGTTDCSEGTILGLEHPRCAPTRARFVRIRLTCRCCATSGSDSCDTFGGMGIPRPSS